MTDNLEEISLYVADRLEKKPPKTPVDGNWVLHSNLDHFYRSTKGFWIRAKDGIVGFPNSVMVRCADLLSGDGMLALIEAMREDWLFHFGQFHVNSNWWDKDAQWRAEFSKRSNFGDLSGRATADSVPEAVLRAAYKALKE